MTPKISIVTTNYNGARFLEKCIQSVLGQNYPDLEYIIIDGGSTDGSQEIIERYESSLAYWESDRDRGFAHAYNKGFSKATGDVLAYLNSDDMYCPWAFQVVSKCFNEIDEMEWLTSLYPMLHSESDGFIGLNPAQPYNKQLFYAGYYGTKLPWIQQESTFWRRSLWKKAGGILDENLNLAIDTELWARFFTHSNLYALTTPLGGFRVRQGSKSATDLAGYLQEMSLIIEKYQNQAYFIKPGKINGITRRLLNLSQSFKQGENQLTGKTIRWDFKKNCYISANTRVFF